MTNKHKRDKCEYISVEGFEKYFHKQMKYYRLHFTKADLGAALLVRTVASQHGGPGFEISDRGFNV